jgi:hypothetical protein
MKRLLQVSDKAMKEWLMAQPKIYSVGIKKLVYGGLNALKSYVIK